MSIADLDSFYEFAKARLASGSVDLSVSQLVDLWQIDNPTPQEEAENIAAIQAALDDMAAGDRGRPVAEVIAELRREFTNRSQP